MVCWRDKTQIYRCMTIFDRRRLGSEPDSFGQFIWRIVRYSRGMEDSHAPASLQKLIQLRELLGVPGAVPIIKDDGIGFFELFGRGPFPGVLHASFRCPAEESVKIRLPMRIIMLAGAMILFVCDKHD